MSAPESPQSVIRWAYVGKLAKLDLSNKNLGEIPVECRKLTQLRSLNVSFNRLRSLDVVTELRSLEKVFLSEVVFVYVVADKRDFVFSM